MTFDKQVKNAKEKQLQNRITRDVVFMLLGLTFLAISIFSTIKEKNNEKNVKEKTTKITTTIKK
ncbi:MAG: hypothetical protein ACI4U0_00600 [Candidatus Aphodocola sp.]